MTKLLHRKLKAARLGLGLTIRDVERLSGNHINNSYVNGLENGRLVCPSPKKLKILAHILKLDYLSLMMAAGYVTKGQLKKAGWNKK